LEINMKKITESQLIEQARGLRAYLSDAAVVSGDGTSVTSGNGTSVQAGKPAPAAAPVPGANPWEGKDPAKAAAWAKLSPQVQKKIGMADPTDNIIVGRMAQGEFGGLFGGGASDANPDGTANQATQVAQASTAANTQVDASLARFKELLAKAAGPDAAQSAKVLAGDAAKNPVGTINAATAIPTGGLENPANQVKESTSYFLEKLRLLESTQVNEALSPEESAELDKLAQSYGDSEDPAIMALMKQYSDVKNAAIKAAPGPTPNQAAKVPPKAWAKGVLGAGSKGPEVNALQKQLGIPETGVFDAATKAAVIKKQTELKVKPDGAWGPASQAAMAAVKETAPPVNPDYTVANPMGETSVTFSNDVESLARIVDLARR